MGFDVEMEGLGVGLGWVLSFCELSCSINRYHQHLAKIMKGTPFYDDEKRIALPF